MIRKKTMIMRKFVPALCFALSLMILSGCGSGNKSVGPEDEWMCFTE